MANHKRYKKAKYQKKIDRTGRWKDFVKKYPKKFHILTVITVDPKCPRDKILRVISK